MALSPAQAAVEIAGATDGRGGGATWALGAGAWVGGGAGVDATGGGAWGVNGYAVTSAPFV